MNGLAEPAACCANDWASHRRPRSCARRDRRSRSSTSPRTARFLQPGNIVHVLRQITYNCILGVGQTFVIITAGIDLSVGSLVSLTGVVMALVRQRAALRRVSADRRRRCSWRSRSARGAGWINALPVVKLNLPPFITTLAMMLEIALGLSFILSHGRPVALQSDRFSAHRHRLVSRRRDRRAPPAEHSDPGRLDGRRHRRGVDRCSTRTRFGRYVFAIGGNEEAARLAGINVARVKTLVYVICGGCAAIVGFLYMALFSSGSPQTGTGDELLESIAAVVVGGTSLMGGRGSDRRHVLRRAAHRRALQRDEPAQRRVVSRRKSCSASSSCSPSSSTNSANATSRRAVPRLRQVVRTGSRIESIRCSS